MSFATQNEISNIQISPSNSSTSVATRIIFSEIRTIYHGHILLNQSVLNQQLLFQLLFELSRYHNNYSFCSSLNHNSAKMLKCIATKFLSTLFLPIRALIQSYKCL